MTRIIKYFKPFIPLIIVAIALLFVQAIADLSLPDLMSNIVNYGIQQGGVVDAVPDAIRKSEMDRLVLFMSAKDRQAALSAYTLVDQNAPDYGAHLDEYPALADEPVYVRHDLDRAAVDRLNPVMGKAFLAVAGVEAVLADPAQMQALAQATGMDFAALPPGTDLFTLLAQLPPDQSQPIMAAMNAKFGAMDDSMIVQAAVGLVRAEYVALGVDTAALQRAYILHTGLLMLLVSLLSGACAIAVGYSAAKTASGLARDLRRLVFRQVTRFSSTEFDRFSTASLITRSTNDITQIQMVVIMMVRMVIYAPIIGVGGVILALNKSTSMWWIIALAVLVLVGMIAVLFSAAMPRFKIMQTLVDRLNLVMRESLSGMMVIRAFNMQPFEENRFDKANRDLTDTSLFVNRLMVIMMPAMMMIMNATSLLIIWVGAHQVAQSAMQVGDMMAFMQYAIQIVFSFLMVAMMFIMLPRAAVSADRIADVIETEPAIRDPQTPQPLPMPGRGRVEFRHVSFRYPGAENDALHDINFVARPGQTTAIIGATGAGKSTLVNLIPRFYDVTGGAVYVDDVDIRQVAQHDLRDRIGYVPQKSALFSGTIDTNLRYADDGAAEETVQEAAEIAQAMEFIAAKPEGMAAEIAQGGMNVSGGQKQRLSLARALVKRAPIYILDDSFSALDFRTDAAVRRALKAKTADSTLLIVTQRVSTIRNAEQIIVLDEGHVQGMGTHDELMAGCETYREIALSQLSREELA